MGGGASAPRHKQRLGPGRKEGADRKDPGRSHVWAGVQPPPPPEEGCESLLPPNGTSNAWSPGRQAAVSPARRNSGP